MANAAHHLTQLSDLTLMETLKSVLREERQKCAEVLRLIAEVDRRRLYLEYASPSLFDFATRVLGLSEGSAYRRIQVARAARR